MSPADRQVLPDTSLIARALRGWQSAGRENRMAWRQSSRASPSPFAAWKVLLLSARPPAAESPTAARPLSKPAPTSGLDNANEHRRSLVHPIWSHDCHPAAQQQWRLAA